MTTPAVVVEEEFRNVLKSFPKTNASDTALRPCISPRRVAKYMSRVDVFEDNEEIST